MTRPAFTAEEQLIADMRREGLTCREMGERIGITRNAVSGIIHRKALGAIPVGARSGVKRVPAPEAKPAVAQGAKPQKSIAVAAGVRKPRRAPVLVAPRPVPLPVQTVVPVEPRLVALPALPDNDGCRYIVEGDRADALYCGLHGFPWCPHHYALAYRPVAERKRAA